MTNNINRRGDERILAKSIFLPSDIIEEIFLYLEKEYSTNPSQLHRIIYSFTWINRNWCQNTIPYLWHKPFYSRRPSNNNKKLRNSNKKIIETLLMSMNEKERKELSMAGFNLPERGKFGSIFDYASFIKELDYFEMFNSIIDWLLEYHLHITNENIRQEYFYQRNIGNNMTGFNDNNIDGLIHLIAFSLMKMFKNHNVQIINLKLIPYNINDYIRDDNCYLLFVDQNYFKCLIENLKYLEVDTGFCDYIFLTSLSKICKNLKYLHTFKDNIRITTNNIKSQAIILNYLISSQRNLESLKISGYTWYPTLMNESILTQINSLKILELNEIDFKSQQQQKLNSTLDIIKLCINLESLTISWCWGLGGGGSGGNYHNIQNFINNSQFPKLSNVIIKGLCPVALRKMAEAYN